MPRCRAKRYSSNSTRDLLDTAARRRAGEALALKRAGAEGVKVFAMDGEVGLTPGAAHET